MRRKDFMFSSVFVALIAGTFAVTSLTTSGAAPKAPGPATDYDCINAAGVAKTGIQQTPPSCPTGDHVSSWAVTNGPTVGATTTTVAPTTTKAPTTTVAPTTTRATTTTVAPTTTQPVTTTTAGGSGCLATGVGCLFDDEFNGSTLDLSKWQPNWLAGNNTDITKPVNSAEISCYDPHQVTETGGNLVLTLANRACTANNGTTYAWASGLVNSSAHFNFTTGTVEARVYLPGANGTAWNWPAVWNGPGSAESDIVEVLPPAPYACWHYHYSNGSQVGGCVPGDFTGWHDYKEVVTATSISYYYDGVLEGTASNTPDTARYLILNNGLHSPDSSHLAGVGDQMLVDYVRVAAS